MIEHLKTCEYSIAKQKHKCPKCINEKKLYTHDELVEHLTNECEYM